MVARTPRTPWLIAAGLAIAATFAVVATSPVDRLDGNDTVATPVPNAPKPVPAPNALGDIDEIRIRGDRVTVRGWAVDLDRPAARRVRISVDGRFAGTADLSTSRPDVAVAHGLGEAGGFEYELVLGPGSHRLCVHTAPDDDYVTCERVAPAGHKGVLETPTGVMVAIERVLPDGYRVTTPCGNSAVVSRGRRVRTTQILIDPGHGGSESAAVGPNGLAEKNLNLDVALRAAHALRERGYSVELTRTTDVRHPIAIRAGLANALEPDVFLSLHHNGGARTRSPVPGTQVYYQHDDTESRRLGGILYEELFAAARRFPTAWVGNALDGVSTRLNAEGGDFYGIHRRTPDVTSVITEFLWLSNGPEARLLERVDVRNAEAEALAGGIDRWYRSRHEGSGFLSPFVDTFDSGGGGFEGCVDPPLGG